MSEKRTPQRLLDAALTVFAERGFSATRTRDVCGLAEANIASLNYHYGSKEKLWVAVCEYCSRWFAEMLTTAIDLNEPDPRVNLSRVVDAIFESHGKDERPIRILIWAAIQAETLDYTATTAQFAKVVQIGVTYLEQLKAQGRIADIDVAIALPLVHGQLVFALTDRSGHRYLHGKDISDPAHRERLKRTFMRGATYLLGLGSSD